MDRNHLQQVLMNLAVNARDAMEGDGTLTIRTAREGGFALLEVTDTGHGIEESILKQIFEPFFSTKPPGRGTGLGLAVVYGIVTQNGGSVTVESQVGEGSRFVVRVPGGESGPVPEEACVEDAPTPPPLAVLLAEDQAEVRTFVAEVLRGAGHRVTEAVDGASALEAARAMPALDLLVTDLSMPGMRGADLARSLLARHPAIAVLCMSGFAGQDATDEWPILQKPFAPEALLEAVRRLRPLV
jgi:two-component system cell cycle sensor histidine kinase/response regulator CckA